VAYPTFNQVQIEVAQRLDDTQNLYWGVIELQQLIIEALRTWNSMARYWRTRATFNLTQGVPYYDLTVVLPSTVMGFNVTDLSLLSTVSFHLLEPQFGGLVYSGSDMFRDADFFNAVAHRTNQFLVESGCVLLAYTGATLLNGPSPTIGRMGLPQTTIDVRKVGWIDQLSQTYTELDRSNEWAASAFKAGWENAPATPQEYATVVEPPYTLQLIPAPQANGQVEMLAVNATSGLGTVGGAGTLLRVPDDYSWAVKFGMMADMLAKSGQAQDLLRADYCEKRFKQGVALARMNSSVVNAQLDGKQVFVNALQNWRYYNQNWRNLAQGPPTDFALASWNLCAVSPRPDANPHSVLLDLVQNAPLPVLAADPVKVNPEELDVIIGYTEHLASFKFGGDEFVSTSPLLDRMIELASVYNERLKASSDFLGEQSDKTIKEEKLKPRRR